MHPSTTLNTLREQYNDNTKTRELPVVAPPHRCEPTTYLLRDISTLIQSQKL
eukprot:COSAG01_NODE_1734_length_9366_cov_4.124636_2_plen_52_part_00